VTALEIPSLSTTQATGENDLPEGWELSTLGECVEILDSRRIPVNSDERATRQGQVPYYGATGQVGWIDDYLFDEELLLLGEDGAPFLDKSQPISYIVGGRSWVNNHAHVVRAVEGLTTNRFLKFWLDAFDFSDYVTGSTRLKLTQTAMRCIPVSLPPASEQHRVVQRIEDLLRHVTVARDHLSRVPAILTRFRQAVLAAACSGRLTEDWRAHRASRTSSAEFLRAILAMRPERVKEQGVGAIRKPADPDGSQLSDIPEEWAIASIDQVSCMVTSGSRGWAKYYAESGPLFIRAQDINTDRLQRDGIAHVEPPDNAEGRRTRVRLGDLLVTITGANVTKAALLDREIGESYVSQHVALVRPVDPSIGQFLYLWVVSPRHGRAKLLDDAYGAGKPGLNLDNIKETTLALPSLEEQQEIVRRVDALFKLADTIEMRVATAARRADKLTESILAKAFRGELVLTEAELARREGREYEPASVLLERIKKERNSGTTPMATRQRSQSKGTLASAKGS